MNNRRVCILALFSGLVAVLSVDLMAQRGGFRVGIAPAFRGPVVTPGFGQPLPVPFGVASSTFGFSAPQIGTPREQVVRQFGSPTVSIVTSTGETLHFSGGVSVFIQNGQVASPR